MPRGVAYYFVLLLTRGHILRTEQNDMDPKSLFQLFRVHIVFLITAKVSKHDGQWQEWLTSSP